MTEEAALVEVTVWEGLAAYGYGPAVEMHDTDRMRLVLTPVAYEGFNALFLGHAGEVESLGETLVAARAANVPTLVHVWPRATEAEGLLMETGLAFYEEEPAMIASTAAAPSQDSSSLRISLAESREELDVWVEILIGRSDRGLRNGIVALRATNPHFEHLLGFIAGEPVACAALFNGSQAAEVQHVVTVKEYRRRGIGASMTAAVLALAHDRGHQHAVLTASPDGAGIYRRLGFRDVAAVRRFLLTPEATASQ